MLKASLKDSFTYTILVCFVATKHSAICLLKIASAVVACEYLLNYRYKPVQEYANYSANFKSLFKRWFSPTSTSAYLPSAVPDSTR